MIAILLTKGTKYDRNDDYSGDVIWMQSQFHLGLNMIAMSDPNRSKYDCNPFQKGPNMIAITEILFLRD